MDRLSDVEVFARVVETASFSNAGRSLGISRSQVSRLIAGLEKRLGVRLLHRTTRKVAPTATGQAFYEASAPLLDGIAAAEARVREEARTPAGTLRVSLPLAFGVRWLNGVLLDFQARHPEVRVIAQFDDRKVDLLAEGLDLAVRGGHVIDGALVARALWPFRLLAAASPAYLARRGVPAEPADLVGHDCLLYGGSARPETWTLIRGDERVDVRVSGPLVYNSGIPLVDAAIAGAGVIVLPDWVMLDALRRGALVRVLPAWEGPGLRFWFVRPDRRHVPERVRAFKDHLLAAFPDPPWLAI